MEFFLLNVRCNNWTELNYEEVENRLWQSAQSPKRKKWMNYSIGMPKPIQEKQQQQKLYSKRFEASAHWELQL